MSHWAFGHEWTPWEVKRKPVVAGTKIVGYNHYQIKICKLCGQVWRRKELEQHDL